MADETLVHVAPRFFSSGLRLPAIVVRAGDLRRAGDCAGTQPLSPLALTLALYELVQSSDPGGMCLADICMHWRSRGHSDSDLRLAMRDAMRAGGFHLMAKAAESRLLPIALECAWLNPANLADIERLIAAYAGLRAHSAGVNDGAPPSGYAGKRDGGLVAVKSAARAVAVPGAVEGVDARRILVVDDDVDTATTCALALDLAGHQTRIAYDGPSALLAAKAFQPEVVLLDIGMPGMSGFEVAKKLRGNPATSAAQIVALTGYDDLEDRRRSRDAGFNHHLVKPARLDQLKEVIATCRSAA